MARDQQMCLSCSDRPATTSNGTVPLCSACKALVTNPRGVEYQGAPKGSEKPTSPQQQPN